MQKKKKKKKNEMKINKKQVKYSPCVSFYKKCGFHLFFLYDDCFSNISVLDSFQK